MLLDVPASLDGLLVLLRPCFSQPSFQTFRALLVGQISQTGLRTVTGMLIGARLSGVWHHARAHRFFSHARWSVDELGLRIAELIIERLTEPGAAIVVAIDDTLLHQAATHDHRRPISPRTGCDAHTSDIHAGPARMGRRRTLRRESRVTRATT